MAAEATWSQADIAAEMGIPPGTVTSWYTRDRDEGAPHRMPWPEAHTAAGKPRWRPSTIREWRGDVPAERKDGDG